jgi:hypothetical protein
VNVLWRTDARPPAQAAAAPPPAPPIASAAAARPPVSQAAPPQPALQIARPAAPAGAPAAAQVARPALQAAPQPAQPSPRPAPTPSPKIGRVISVSGCNTQIELSLAPPGGTAPRAEISSLARIRAQNIAVIGVISGMSMQPAGAQGEKIVLDVVLVGEIQGTGFQRGIAHFPSIGDEVYLAGGLELGRSLCPAGNHHAQRGHSVSRSFGAGAADGR